jgi:hypothetical protein
LETSPDGDMEMDEQDLVQQQALDEEGSGDEMGNKRTKSRKVCVFDRRNNCKFGEQCKYLHTSTGTAGGAAAANRSSQVAPGAGSKEDSSATGVQAKASTLAAGEGGVAVELDPAKYRTKPCRFFRRGHCNTGDACPFLHVRGGVRGPPRMNKSRVLEPFFDTQQKRAHEEDHAVAPHRQAAAASQPQQENDHSEASPAAGGEREEDPTKLRTKPCRYFRRGKCNSGDACKFLHTERSSSSPSAASSTLPPKHLQHPSAISSSSAAVASSELKQLPPGHIYGNHTLPPEILESRIRTKPCTYFRRGHCRAGDDCLFLHVSDAEARAMKSGSGHAGGAGAVGSSITGGAGGGTGHLKKHTNNNKHHATSQATFAIYSTSNDKKKTKEINFPLEDGRVSADHFEDLDPYVVLVSWEIRPLEFPNYVAIKRGLHDIFVENLGFYETNSPSVLEADVASLCDLLKMKPSEDVHRVIPALRARLNALIDAGLIPNNGLYGDYNAAAAWLNTIFLNECDSMPTSPKEEAAPLVMYFARRPAVFA